MISLKTDRFACPSVQKDEINHKKSIISFGKFSAINQRAINLEDTDVQLRLFRSKDKALFTYPLSMNKDKVALMRKFLKNCKNINIDKIAISSNSTIYKISDDKNEITVKMQHFVGGSEKGVIKRLNSDYTDEIAQLKRLPSEMDNIPHILGCIKEKDNIIAILLDYIPGNPLDGAKHKITSEMLNNLYRNLLILDKSKILHRDLSVNNVLITPDKISITDFGASKTFDELSELSKKTIKYKSPDFIYPSNLENFEFLALLTYLRQVSNAIPNGAETAGNLFSDHLGLKADYHKQRVQIIEKLNIDNKKEVLKNEQILADVFDLYNSTQDKAVKNAIRKVELLKLKTLNAQKMSRLFFENDTTNYITGLYWNNQEGFLVKDLVNRSRQFIKIYGSNPVLKSYFNLQLKLADFHYNEIYKPMIKINREKADTALENDEVKNINSVIANGNILAIHSVNGNWLGPCACIYKDEKPFSGEF